MFADQKMEGVGGGKGHRSQGLQTSFFLFHCDKVIKTSFSLFWGCAQHA